MNIVVETKHVRAFLPPSAAALGHVRLVPLHERAFFSDCTSEEIHEMGALANAMSSALFELLNAEGTNVIMTELPVRFDVLARFSDDGLELSWKPGQISQTETEAVAAKIRDKIDEPVEIPVLKQEVTSKQEVPTQRQEAVPTAASKISDQKPSAQEPVQKPRIRFVRRIP